MNLEDYTREIHRLLRSPNIDDNLATVCGEFKQFTRDFLANTELAFEYRLIAFQNAVETFTKFRKTYPNRTELDDLGKYIFIEIARLVLGIEFHKLNESEEPRRSFKSSIVNAYSELTTAKLKCAHDFLVLQWLMVNYWTHPTLVGMMQGEDFDEERALTYLKMGEYPELFKLRIELLIESGCEPQALNLCKWCARSPVFATDVTVRLTQLLLLHRLGKMQDFYSQCYELSCCVGAKIIANLMERSGEAEQACADMARTFLLQDWTKPANYCCTAELLRMWIQVQRKSADVETFLHEVSKVAHTFRNTKQLNLLCDVLHNLYENEFIDFCTDVELQALKNDRNELNSRRPPHNSSVVSSQTIPGDDPAIAADNLAQTCRQVARLYHSSDVRMSFNCLLTALYLDPRDDTYKEILRYIQEKGEEIVEQAVVDKNDNVEKTSFEEVLDVVVSLRPAAFAPKSGINGGWKALDAQCLHYLEEIGLKYNKKSDSFTKLEQQVRDRIRHDGNVPQLRGKVWKGVKFCGRPIAANESPKKEPGSGNEQKNAICSQCQRTFNSPWHLKRHMRNVHGGNTGTSNLGEEAVSNAEDELDQSDWPVIDEQEIKEYLDHEDDLLPIFDIMDVGNEPLPTTTPVNDRLMQFQCRYCQKDFLTMRDRRRHEEWSCPKRNTTNNVAKRTDFGHQCPICHKLLSTKGSLNRHIKLVHNAEVPGKTSPESNENNNEKPVSPVSEDDGGDLPSEEEMEEKERQKCRFCFQRFESHSACQRHEMICAEGPNKPTNICELCGKSCKNEEEKRTHLEVEHADSTGEAVAGDFFGQGLMTLLAKEAEEADVNPQPAVINVRSHSTNSTAILSPRSTSTTSTANETPPSKSRSRPRRPSSKPSLIQLNKGKDEVHVDQHKDFPGMTRTLITVKDEPAYKGSKITCEVCSAQFVDSQTAHNHATICASPGSKQGKLKRKFIYFCPFCETVINNANSVPKHVRQCKLQPHDLEPNLMEKRCSLADCERVFYTWPSLQAHMNWHQRQGDLPNSDPQQPISSPSSTAIESPPGNTHVTPANVVYGNENLMSPVNKEEPVPYNDCLLPSNVISPPPDLSQGVKKNQQQMAMTAQLPSLGTMLGWGFDPASGSSLDVLPEPADPPYLAHPQPFSEVKEKQSQDWNCFREFVKQTISQHVLGRMSHTTPVSSSGTYQSRHLADAEANEEKLAREGNTYVGENNKRKVKLLHGEPIVSQYVVECTGCNTMFASQKRWKVHKEKRCTEEADSSSIAVYECLFCKKCFSAMMDCRRHQLNCDKCRTIELRPAEVVPEFFYVCEECSMLYTKSANYITHRIAKHGVDRELAKRMSIERREKYKRFNEEEKRKMMEDEGKRIIEKWKSRWSNEPDKKRKKIIEEKVVTETLEEDDESWINSHSHQQSSWLNFLQSDDDYKPPPYSEVVRETQSETRKTEETNELEALADIASAAVRLSVVATPTSQQDPLSTQQYSAGLNELAKAAAKVHHQSAADKMPETANLLQRSQSYEEKDKVVPSVVQQKRHSLPEQNPLLMQVLTLGRNDDKPKDCCEEEPEGDIEEEVMEEEQNEVQEPVLKNAQVHHIKPIQEKVEAQPKSEGYQQQATLNTVTNQMTNVQNQTVTAIHVSPKVVTPLSVNVTIPSNVSSVPVDTSKLLLQTLSPTQKSPGARKVPCSSGSRRKSRPGSGSQQYFPMPEATMQLREEERPMNCECHRIDAGDKCRPCQDAIVARIVANVRKQLDEEKKKQTEGGPVGTTTTSMNVLQRNKRNRSRSTGTPTRSPRAKVVEGNSSTRSSTPSQASPRPSAPSPAVLTSNLVRSTTAPIKRSGTEEDNDLTLVDTVNASLGVSSSSEVPRPNERQTAVAERVYMHANIITANIAGRPYNKLQCRHCMKEYDTFMNLAQHIQNDHRSAFVSTTIQSQKKNQNDGEEEPEVDQFSCHKCKDVKFERESSLKSHMKVFHKMEWPEVVSELDDKNSSPVVLRVSQNSIVEGTEQVPDSVKQLIKTVTSGQKSVVQNLTNVTIVTVPYSISVAAFKNVSKVIFTTSKSGPISSITSSTTTTATPSQIHPEKKLIKIETEDQLDEKRDEEAVVRRSRRLERLETVDYAAKENSSSSRESTPQSRIMKSTETSRKRKASDCSEGNSNSSEDRRISKILLQKSLTTPDERKGLWKKLRNDDDEGCSSEGSLEERKSTQNFSQRSLTPIEERKTLQGERDDSEDGQFEGNQTTVSSMQPDQQLDEKKNFRKNEDEFDEVFSEENLDDKRPVKGSGTPQIDDRKNLSKKRRDDEDDAGSEGSLDDRRTTRQSNQSKERPSTPQEERRSLRKRKDKEDEEEEDQRLTRGSLAAKKNVKVVPKRSAEESIATRQSKRLRKKTE